MNKRLLNKASCLILVILCILLVSSSGARGEDKKIRVVYTEWFPYTFQENGEASGFEIQTFKAVMKNMNIAAEFVMYPWKRCLDNLKKGKADVLISFLKTPEREGYAHFPGEYISISKTVFFTKADKDIPYSGSFEELKKYSVGVISGFSYGDAFDKAELPE
ncbi:transporter substrate-binding domain-containing protein [Desulfococcaceae bacterium HSG8]|nr:transporter substrate-binding domain-containing protein [Desulfococcaceae bacterium HSG8]